VEVEDGSGMEDEMQLGGFEKVKQGFRWASFDRWGGMKGGSDEILGEQVAGA